MYRKLWLPFLTMAFLFTACAPVLSAVPVPGPGDSQAEPLPAGNEQPGQTPYTPVNSDASLKRGDVKIDSLVVRVSNGYPPQYQLEVKGSLPTPCHQLRTAVKKPNMENEIAVQIYSVYDPYTACAQVESPFETSLPLGSYVRGSYTVLVNEREVGEIVP